jgi:hypothetical protein
MSADSSSFKPIVSALPPKTADVVELVRAALEDECRAVIIDCKQKVIVVHPNLDRPEQADDAQRITGDSLMYLLSVTRVSMLDGLWGVEPGYKALCSTYELDSPKCAFHHPSRSVDLPLECHPTKHIDPGVVMVLQQSEQSVALYGYLLEEI